MSAWPRVALGEVVRHRKEFVTIDDDRLYRRCRVQTSARGVVLRDTLQGLDIKTKTQQVCRGGEFLVAEIDAKMGGYGLVPPELDGAIVSSHYFLFTADEKRLNRAYLAWYAKTPEFFAQVQAVGSTNYAAIRPSHVLGYSIPLPPLEQQRRVVARLDGAAARVGRAKAGIREIDADLLQAARNVIWNAGSRADAWTPCGSFLVQRPLDVQVEPETDYPFAGVYSFGRGVFRTEIKRGSTFSYPALTRLRTDDFVYPKLMAWEGALGVVPAGCDGLVVSPEFPVFQIDSDRVRPIIIDTFFRDPRALPMLQAASSGTNMRRRRIQPGRFLALKVPVPTPREQNLVSALLVQRIRMLDRHRESLEGLDRLLPAMLHEEFGE